MADEIATRSAWKTLPMPTERTRLEFRLTLSEAQFERVQRGVVPAFMEDRWFAYVENDCLFLHRSWTGFCIYTLRFLKQADGWTVCEIWANRDDGQYKMDDAAADARRLTDAFRYLFDIRVPETRA